MLSNAIVLGPQRKVPRVRDAVAALIGDSGAPLAVVTAGWEEREDEDQELREHVQRPVVNLAVWQRVERIFEKDRELLRAMRERHDTLRRVQDLYRLRLGGLMDATRELLRRGNGDALLEDERRDSLLMVQQLDEQHRARVASVHAVFEERFAPRERDAVVRERRELHRSLDDAACLLIAGGHVAVLLHRMNLFDVVPAFGDRPVVAWSAGAMALCERIVLFHDTPPQGSSYAEVMESGCAVLPGFVALPHADKRLVTDDALRVQMLARRFAPALCALLDHGAWFRWDGSQWSAGEGSRRLHVGGWAEAFA